MTNFKQLMGENIHLIGTIEVSSSVGHRDITLDT